MSCRLAFAFLVATTGGAAVASTDVTLDRCDLATGWGVSLADQGLAFSRGDATPARIELSGGRLVVDGRDVALDAEDRRRLREYEATVRELLPEAKAIALEAIEIAFTAVDEVARMFAPDDAAGYAATAEKLATARIMARRQVEDAFAGRGWSEAEMERLIEDAVRQLLPALVGDIVGTAVRVALSGDEAAAKALERRAERMEREIEQRIEGRAKALERRAEAFCPRLAELDRLESTISAEIAPGQRFDLVRVAP